MPRLTDAQEKVLIRVAGFLRMVSEGQVALPAQARDEASDLFDRVGEILCEPEAPAPAVDLDDTLAIPVQRD